MKKFINLFLIFAVVLFTACEGPPGIDGIDGVDGEDGLIGTVFEIEGDFKAEFDYKMSYEFPGDFKVYDGDIVMVYILWEIADTDNGDKIDVWRALPQTRIFEDGILQYNFDYTIKDVQIFLSGTIDFGTLTSGDTDNQIFRVAILPAELAENKSVDIRNLNSLMNSPEIKIRTIEK